MSNLSMLDCYTILARCSCLARTIRLLRTLDSSLELVWSLPVNASEPGDQSLVLNMHKRLGLTDYSEECVHKEDTCIGKHLGSAAIFRCDSISTVYPEMSPNYFSESPSILSEIVNMTQTT